MINLKDIEFGYIPQRKIFSGLTLDLEPGHIYGLLGKNGMGKTTLLKIMSGLRFVKSGEVLVFDKKVENRTPDILNDIYFVTEEMDLPPITIEEYVSIYAPFYPNFSIEEFDKYLSQFELDARSSKLTKLSHGQKKKFIVSFGLAANTKIVIMDEPTNGMDIPSKSAFRKVVSSAIDENKIMIISTHQVRDLQNVIDSIIVLGLGKILLNQSINEILDKLSFNVLNANDFERLSQQGKILYYEDNLLGKFAVCERSEEQNDDKFDMELLFCAVIANSDQINKIFNK